ncbi:MAG: hypothetical protein HJJLKODD_02721 [Phycisphaerae bacterium]|nr:hypothetical protein [Phycisphaerae bacterium]
MPRRLFALLHLLFELLSARRDARIRFLLAQVSILKRKLGGNRVLLRPEDRAELLRIGCQLDHEVKQFLGIVTLGTYRRCVRQQRNGQPAKRVGRPRIPSTLRRLIVRLSKENIAWGYRRIRGELAKLHLSISHASIRRILAEKGIFPPPRMRADLHLETPWRKFLRLHMNTLVACDFLTKTIITPLGGRVAYVLFFIHLSTRRVFICPPTYQPNARWITGQTQNALAEFKSHRLKTRFLLRDHDGKFTPAFDRFLEKSGVEVIKTPIGAPNANAYAEAWVGSFKRECLNYFLCFGLRHLQHIAREYVTFYNRYRPHQGIGNQPLPTGPPSTRARRQRPTSRISGAHATAAADRPIRCQRFLGGLLKHYYQPAA